MHTNTCVLGFDILISKQAERNQKRWLNDTAWSKVLVQSNAGLMVSATQVKITDHFLPTSSFTNKPDITTINVPASAGNNRMKNTSPPSRSAIFPRRGVSRGTSINPYARFSPSSE
ncbi:MAG: hypothetical protein OEQ53_08825 [Saprospiraceae bacterium]|nr:hypothetical protein [Saprospiraceae bacterium]